MVSLLWLATILLVVLWLLGYAVNIGVWVNILLVFAVALFILNLVGMFTRRPVVHRDVHDVDEVHDHDVHVHHHDDVV